MLIRSPLRLAAKTLAVLIVAYPGFVVSLTVARLGAYAHGCNGRGSDFVCHSMSPTGLTELVGTQPAQNVAITRENRRDRMPGSCYYTTL